MPNFDHMTHCKNGHELTPFNIVARGIKNPVRRCRICATQKERHYTQKYREAHKGNMPNRRDYFLRRKFGITLDEYNKLLELQNGLCAICGKSEELSKTLAVDHSHITGINRGLLCFRCNTSVGVYEKYSTVIEAYLRKWTPI